MSVLRIISAVAGAALLGAALITVWVERTAPPVLETLVGRGRLRALVLYHPSRDAHFSDQLSQAVADGLGAAGFSVDRQTAGGATPPRPQGYALLVVVANTYWWQPDWPTLRTLKRADWRGLPVIGLIGGAGSTARSERLLSEALLRTGALSVETRSFWLFRPNDESRMQEANRAVALDRARQWGREAGARMLTTAGPG